MCLPALDALRQQFPEGRIGFLVCSPFGDLYEGHRSIDEIFSASLPRHKNLDGLVRGGRLLRIIASFDPDAAFLFVGTPRYLELILRLAGVRQIYRVPNYAGIRCLLTNRALSPDNDWDRTKHGIEDRLRVVRLFGVPAQLSPMRLPIHDSWKKEAAAWLDKRGWAHNRIVLLQPGAGSAGRRWPQERFAELARRLASEVLNVRCVVTGSPQEREYCARVVELANDSRVARSAGELSLGGLAGLMSRAAVLVTPDTGTMHLGHAVGINSICLYTGSGPKRTGALDDGFLHINILRRSPRGVSLSQAELDNAMSLISVEDVHEACTTLLRREPMREQTRSSICEAPEGDARR